MSPITLRARLRRWRHHAALAALLSALTAVIALHHGAPAIGADHHAEIFAVAEMCLGVLTAVGAAVVAVGLALIAFGRRRPAILHRPGGALCTARLQSPRVRAGPTLLVLMCVSRR